MCDGIVFDPVSFVAVVPSANDAVAHNIKRVETDHVTSVPVVVSKQNKAQANVCSENLKEETKEAPFIPKWGKALKAIMVVSIVGFMIAKDQHLNIFYLCGRIIHLILFPIVSLRDVDAPLNKPTTVEYNIQTHALVGLLSYTIAFVILGMNTSNPLSMWFSSFGRSQPYMALSIAAGFENNDKLFNFCFCNPFNHSGRKLLDRLMQELSLPLCLGSLLALQSVNQLTEYNFSITLAAGVLFLYRMMNLAREYQHAGSLTTETYPDQVVFTKFAERNVETVATTNPEGHEYVWRIYGNVYDVTDFVNKHPGGVESIVLAANREDSTAAFQSYHAFNIRKAKAVLEKYRISPATESEDDKQCLSSNTVGHHNDLFYEELVKRVSKKLRENGVDPVKDRYANWERYMVYAILLPFQFITLYYHLTGSLIGSFLSGVCAFYIGGHIGHDGGHYSISRYPWVNDMFQLCISLICNPIIWQHQHTYAHHSFTNQHDHDPDLHHFHILMRYSPLEKFFPWYKMQIHALYALWAFGWTDFGTCYWNSWRFVFERSLHGTVQWTDRKRWLRTAKLLFHLAGYSAICYIIPFWYHKRGFVALLAGVIHMSTSGFLFGIFSQAGHISEQALGRDRKNAKKPRHEIAKVSWAAEQVEDTNDFCPQNTLWYYLGSLLGLQIEHHLFPILNHCHLQMIQPTVEECCKEYNVVYKKYDTFNDAISDTIKYIATLSTDNSLDMASKKLD